MTQMFELAAGHNVKPAPHLREMTQNGKVSVGFDGETYCVRNLPEAAVELAVSIRDRRAAVKISRRAEGSGSSNEVDAFAKHMLDVLFFRGLFPSEMRRELGW